MDSSAFENTAFGNTLTHHIEPSPDGEVLRIHGEVNLTTAGAFTDLLHAFVAGKRTAILDLMGVSVMNIQGMQALEEVSRSRTIRLKATRFIWHMLGVLRLRDRFQNLAD